MSVSQTFTRALVAVLPVVAMAAPQAFAQDIDAMAKWTALTVVHYKVVGEFSGESRLLSFEITFPVRDSVNVTDRIEVEFDWDQQEMKLVGKPVFRNFSSKAGALAPIQGCPGTKIDGIFEFATAVGVKELPYRGFSLVLKRDYPGGSVPHPARESGTAACGYKWETIAPKSETIDGGFGGIPNAMMLAMPADKSPYPISKDGKSLIVKNGGWTWTFTPTPVK